ncbi:hypothetical protein L2E82_11967 [Cichorium intybus]|uniref:Uncharacterized protein n=1 Tax=Cichorium intybus TaxID=13427 RepID=A0ACB9GES1_CICIN|nr:hypothetical protein L2E82_11967 [Cichorium intybus]
MVRCRLKRRGAERRWAADVIGRESDGGDSGTVEAKTILFELGRLGAIGAPFSSPALSLPPIDPTTTNLLPIIFFGHLIRSQTTFVPTKTKKSMFLEDVMGKTSSNQTKFEDGVGVASERKAEGVYKC